MCRRSCHLKQIVDAERRTTDVGDWPITKAHHEHCSGEQLTQDTAMKQSKGPSAEHEKNISWPQNIPDHINSHTNYTRNEY